MMEFHSHGDLVERKPHLFQMLAEVTRDIWELLPKVAYSQQC